MRNLEGRFVGIERSVRGGYYLDFSFVPKDEAYTYPNETIVEDDDKDWLIAEDVKWPR